MSLIKWLKSIFPKQATEGSFHKTFSGLQYHAHYSRSVPARKLYDMLPQLDASSPEAFTDELVQHLQGISYSTNTTGFFNYFFPIVSHILYFKPELSGRLLPYLVGPSVGNGIIDTEKMIASFKSAMYFQLKQDPHYLTPEGQQWVLGALQDLKVEIELAIKEELDDR